MSSANSSLSVRSLHVLPVLPWVFSGYSGFLPPSKHIDMNVGGCGCGWRLLEQTRDQQLPLDNHEPRSSAQTSPSLRRLSNGYILPEGEPTPNAIFVGGIDMKVDENKMWDFFSQFGAVKEVKKITYRGRICKGYGFVYFNEEVNIQLIIDQQISFQGRKLKLGPAIMKDRSARSMPSHLIAPAPWMSPRQYFYCTRCSPVGGSLAQPAPVLSGGGPYSQGEKECLNSETTKLKQKIRYLQDQLLPLSKQREYQEKEIQRLNRALEEALNLHSLSSSQQPSGQGNFNNLKKQELLTQIAVLKEQVKIFREDFRKERVNQERLNEEKEDLRRQVERLQGQITDLTEHRSDQSVLFISPHLYPAN